MSFLKLSTKRNRGEELVPGGFENKALLSAPGGETESSRKHAFAGC